MNVFACLYATVAVWVRLHLSPRWSRHSISLRLQGWVGVDSGYGAKTARNSCRGSLLGKGARRCRTGSKHRGSRGDRRSGQRGSARVRGVGGVTGRARRGADLDLVRPGGRGQSAPASRLRACSRVRHSKDVDPEQDLDHPAEHQRVALMSDSPPEKHHPARMIRGPARSRLGFLGCRSCSRRRIHPRRLRHPAAVGPRPRRRRRGRRDRGDLLLDLALAASSRQVGAETLIGAVAEVVSTCRPDGQVRVQGELWRARCEEGADRGETVRVVDRDGLTLRVEHA